MRLDGKRFFGESRARTHISDGIERLFVYASASQVDAIAGNQFVITAEVDRRHGVSVPIAASPAGRRSNAEYIPQQMPGPADLACAQKITNMAAGNRTAAHHHHGIGLYLETELAPQF